MASSALPIIEEFLRAAGPQQRKNALTALAVVGDEADVRMLAQSALSDDDAGVRAHALSEIASLGEEKAAAAVDVFERELLSGDRAKQVRAYAVLGRLQSEGAYETKVRLTLRRRLLLAASLYRQLYLVKNWDFRLRSWRAGLLGSLAGSLIFVPATVMVALRRPVYSQDIIYYAIFVLIIIGGGAVMSMTATQRATPINLHISRFAALPAEMLAATLLGFIGILGYYVVINALVPRSVEQSLQTVGLLLLGGILAAMVRGVSGLAFGIYTNPKINWLAEALAGTAAGFVLVAIIVLTNVRVNGTAGRIVSMASIPFAMGCASAFASIDIASPPARSLRGRSSLLIRLLFFPVVIALSMVVGFVLLLVTQ